MSFEQTGQKAKRSIALGTRRQIKVVDRVRYLLAGLTTEMTDTHMNILPWGAANTAGCSQYASCWVGGKSWGYLARFGQSNSHHWGANTSGLAEGHPRYVAYVVFMILFSIFICKLGMMLLSLTLLALLVARWWQKAKQYAECNHSNLDHIHFVDILGVATDSRSVCGSRKLTNSFIMNSWWHSSLQTGFAVGNLLIWPQRGWIRKAAP